MTGKRADKTVVKLLFTTAILLAAGTCCPGAETGCSDGMAAPSRSALTRPEDTYRKTGFSFTPIPALSYSSDLGFQLGAILDAYLFGDGSTYPKYRHKLTAEACYYTKGSGIYYLFYDSEYLIRGLRFTASASYLPNTMMAFYGFNGYPAPFLRDKNAGFYAVDRNLLRIMGDLQGPYRRPSRLGGRRGLFPLRDRTHPGGKICGRNDALRPLPPLRNHIRRRKRRRQPHRTAGRSGVRYPRQRTRPFVRSLCRPAALRLARHHRPARLPLPEGRRFVPPLPAAHSGQAGFRLPSMLAGNGSRSGPPSTYSKTTPRSS